MDLKLLIAGLLVAVYLSILIFGNAEEPERRAKLAPPPDEGWIKVSGVEVDLILDSSVSTPNIENCVYSNDGISCGPRKEGKIEIAPGKIYVSGVAVDVSGEISEGELRIDSVMVDFEDLRMKAGRILVSAVMVNGRIHVESGDVVILVDSPNCDLVVIGEKEHLEKALIVGPEIEIAGR